jgi:hypothetical protein
MKVSECDTYPNLPCYSPIYPAGVFTEVDARPKTTKHLELRFHALLGNGDREVRLEWGQGKRLVEGDPPKVASCSPHKIAQYGDACLSLLPYAVLIADRGGPDSLK